ncbi:MAG: DNA cytosine methyltransferase [Proteobacteria bacterium]|nr:DNA cytosine methyltransferase [Pseudomonadota bacterium]
MIPDVISTKEAAELMQLTEQRVRTLLKQGKIAGQQLGKQWLVDRQNLEQFLAIPQNHVNPPDKKRNSKSKPDIVALSFFSGAMGLDLGLKKAGIEVMLACEFDKACRKTIAANNPDIALLGDVWNYSAEQIREAAGLSLDDDIDLIVGGPPCQAFSTAGSRRGFNDQRGGALIRYLELIEQLKPKYAVLENVRGLLSAPLSHRPHADRDEKNPLTEEEQAGGALLLIVQRLKQAGYGVSFNLYNSANYGSPQVRERVVLICHRGGEELPYLEPTHSDKLEFNLPQWNTFRSAVEGLESIKHEHLTFPEGRLRYYRLLGPGEYWKNLPLELQKEALGKSFYAGGGKTGFLRRLAWDKPSPTLVTHPAMPATDLAHPVENRPLSIQEYKRVQQFPDEWVICGSLVDQYKQVGNAVPAGLGEAIGKLILNHMNGKPIKVYEGFSYSRYKETDHRTWLAKHSAIGAVEKKSKKKAGKLNKNNMELFDFA